MSEHFHGTREEARARRSAVLDLFRRKPGPLSLEDVWLQTRPRLTRGQALKIIEAFRREGVLEVHTMSTRRMGGQPTTYRLVARPAVEERSA